MRPPSIRRRLMIWVLSALSVGALVLVLTAYWLTLGEIDEVLDDSLRQTGLLLADRDLAGVLPAQPVARLVPSADTESQLVAIARTPDGMLLFTSAPELSLRFDATPELSSQRVNEAQWRVFTVVHADRITQVAQPISVRQGVAAESASQLLLPLFVLITLIGAMLLVALRRGMDPLRLTSEALARRSASSLTPLEVQGVPMELLPLMRTLNDLLHRLSQAFEAQRHFVADAAHELRSPLTALQLQIQVLERSRGPAERAEATTELLAGVARARRLVEQLLYLSRASAGDNAGVPLVREPVTLRDVAQAVVARWSLEAEHRHIDLGVDAESESSVDGDAAQLEILLGNLVENALRYTRRGGVVDVVAGDFGGLPALRVFDNGPGIVEMERLRVFDRFYRSPEAAVSAEMGSGLGLAIVKAIADRHDAVVSLHAGREGIGLEVRVVFPASPSPPRPRPSGG